MFWRQWSPYVPVARRRANALRKMEKLRKKGKDIQPVKIEGRTIARSFWGRGWCDHLESFSDYENRLPRGRTYVRNGSVCHLSIQPGRIEAIVSGSELYNTSIRIKRLKPAIWKSVKERCAGQIGSMLELLQGRLSDQVMTVVTDRARGLFPQPSEIELACSCPDWAVMCKHVAAALYGVGSRLDNQPELLFLLRDVDAQELISTEMAMPGPVATGDSLDDDQLGDIFGIDLDVAGTEQPAPRTETKKQRHADKRAAIPSRDRVGAVAPSRARRTRTPARDQAKVSEKAKRKVARAAGFSPRGVTNRGGYATDGPAPAGNPASATPKIRPTGKSVIRLRKQLGLSVAKFARQLDVSAATVYRWEATTGRLKLLARPLAALAKLQQQARRG
ncbi:MAG: SWIM zinc finger family protein [Planctomycetes bacterium]|nr:SWIM zinc finger family protein [Planctomycetota bacterium]